MYMLVDLLNQYLINEGRDLSHLRISTIVTMHYTSLRMRRQPIYMTEYPVLLERETHYSERLKTTTTTTTVISSNSSFLTIY